MEIFSRKYSFSWTQQCLFDPENNSFELWSDGNIEIESLEFNEVGRIWDDLPEIK